ncbi:uncharacterized protein LOC129743803 [Uranotaenia lowii]|uniref:uncharacterized protein LOC129743803 n=1 Tax=Uranotaenia lowii TaxID=190385 RepID=UPI00247B166C|nr:uncharacterized protein LOC129743803 [Uranotaenia lowii]
MKVFIALLIASMAIANSCQGSVISSSVWPPYSTAWNHWNGWNPWNALGFPYTEWPSYAYGGPYGYKTVVQANWGKPGYPWSGYPWSAYGAAGYYGWGPYGKAVVPVDKMVAATPGSLHIAPVPVGGIKAVY